MDLRQILEQRFLSPVVVVVASPDVEQASERNGLIFQQLLQAFAKCPNDLYARVGDKTDSSAIRRFALRLYRPDNLRELEPRLRMEHFTQLLRDHAQLELAYGEQLDPVLVSVMQATTPVEPTLDSRAASTLLERSTSQWSDQFILDYLNIVRCSYFDTTDHPVGYILAVSAGQSPAAVFEQVAALEARARSTRDGVPPMDDDPHVHLLLVHDRSSATTNADAERTFGDVQLRYSGRCSLVHINSAGNTPRRQCDPTPFVECNAVVDCYATNGTGKRYRRVEPMFPAAGVGTESATAAAVNGMLVTGCFLTNEDQQELRNAMSFYMSQSLLPHMERKLRILFQSVNEKRQSTLSKVAAWFKKDEAKPKSELFVLSNEPGVPAKYLYSSVEIQMRRAGDLCMFLRDFDTAASYFRMCRDELQNTVAQRDFNKQLIAACQDAIGMTMYFQGKLPMPGNPRNDCRLELAREEYSKAAVHSYAFRTSLILFLMCKLRAPPAYDKATQVLQGILRAPGGISANKIYAPVLHEMCAAVVLFTNPPCVASQGVVVPANHPVQCNVRKYARLLAIAGSTYAEAGLPENALRSYLRALRVYARSASAASFQYIFEHMHVAVAQLFVKCSRSTKAIGCFTVLMQHGSPQLAAPHGSVRMLDIYAKSLVNWMSEHDRSLVPLLAVPVFHVDSVQLAHSGGSMGGSAAAASDDTTEQEERHLGFDLAAMEWAVLDDACRSFYGEKTQLLLPAGGTKLSQAASPFPPAASSATTNTATLARKASGSAPQSHLASLGESFCLSVLASNPLGVPVTAEDVALLYLPLEAAAAPAPSSSSSALPTPPPVLLRGTPLPSVTIPALKSERIVLALSPETPGECCIVGLAWSMSGIPGQLIFASRRAVPGYRETAFEYAAENSSPSAQLTSALDPAKVIRVTFGAPVARLTATVDPPFPAAVRDGQYLRANIIFENHSTTCHATNLLLCRSPNNAHLLYFPSYSASDNAEDFPRPLQLPNMEPGEKLSIPVVYRAQYAGRLSRCINNVLFSVSYLPHSGAAPAEGTASASTLAAKRTVRLVRFLRRIVVRPVFNANAIVSLASSSSAQSQAAGSNSAAEMVATTPLAAVTLLLCNVGQRTDHPVIVSRVVASHARGWRAQALPSSAAASAVDCVVGTEQSFSLGFTLGRDPAAAASTSADDAMIRDTDLLHAASSQTSAPDHRRRLAQQTLGTSIAADPVHLYFSTKAHVGAGAMGESAAGGGGDDFSFYLDKGGGKKAEHVLRQERWHAETDLYGAPLQQYPPILLTVAWRSDDDTTAAGGHPAFGQLFHFVDVAGRLLRPLTTRDWIVKNVPTLMSVPAALAQPAYVAMLADGFRLSETLAERSRANLLVQCARPRAVQTTAASPLVAHVHLAVRFRCLSAVPLRVEVAFREPPFTPFFSALHGRPLVFSGKTKVKFVILPDEEFTTSVVGTACSPGLYNCNSLDVRVTPIKFSAALRTGTTIGLAASAMDELKGGLFDKLAVLGAETPWPCMVEFTHPTTTITTTTPATPDAVSRFVLKSTHDAAIQSATSQYATLKAAAPATPAASTAPATPELAAAAGGGGRERSLSTIVRRARGTSLVQSSMPSTIASNARSSVRRGAGATSSGSGGGGEPTTPQLSHSFAAAPALSNTSGLQLPADSAAATTNASLPANTSFTAGSAPALQEPAPDEGVEMLGDDMPVSGSHPADSQSPEPSQSPIGGGETRPPGTVVEAAPSADAVQGEEEEDEGTAAAAAAAAPSSTLMNQAVLYDSPVASPRPTRKGRQRNVFEDSSSSETEREVAAGPLGLPTPAAAAAAKHARAVAAASRSAASVEDKDDGSSSSSDDAGRSAQ